MFLGVEKACIGNKLLIVNVYFTLYLFYIPTFYTVSKEATILGVFPKIEALILGSFVVKLCKILVK